MMVEDAIDRLVMDNSHKGMVKAIAKTYTDSTQSGRFSADFIHGKGEGQVILLHGPPGTGKTLTAGKCCCTIPCMTLSGPRISSRVHTTPAPQHHSG
jgi:SpoVK/Ycf46/Vps4 family AAA+-type ATPase